MKVRNGFVSNSSSSSFCIYGLMMDTDELLKKLNLEFIYNQLKATAKSSSPIHSETLEEFKERLKDDDYELSEILWQWPKITYQRSDWGDSYLGISWPNINEDETGAQFKERVRTTLQQLFLEDIEASDLDTHEEVLES